MKKFIFGLIATVMLTSFSFGQDSPKKFDDYKIFGQIHNEYLDYFFENYSKEINIDTDKKMVLERIKESINKFSSANKYLASFSNEVVFGSSYLSDNYYSRILKVNWENNSLFQLNYIKKYSDVQREYLDRIINSVAEDYLVYQSNIDDLMKKLEIDKRLDESNKSIIYFSASIGYYSSEYWQTNGPKLQEVLHNGTTYSKLPPGFWRNFLKADCVGAIVGAIDGAGSGAVVVPVIGAVPGVVVGAAGGAFIASCSWGIAELLFEPW
jgi:hypothetical protein